MSVRCDRCGWTSPAPSRFCGDCGRALADASDGDGRRPDATLGGDTAVGGGEPEATPRVKPVRIRPAADPPGPSHAPPLPAPGDVIAERYEIHEVLAHGGMGQVVSAYDRLVREHVAIKFMHPEIVRGDEEVKRFLREGRLARSLNHPNVVRTMNIESHGALHYIVMERLQGCTLRKWMSDHGIPSPPELVAAVGDQALAALEEAHALGIVHRDIKPQNIWVEERPEGWRIKLTDFGLAKVFDAVDGDVTQTSRCLGTPAYMAPEQGRLGQALDHRADLYAVGVVLHEMLTGTLPTEHTHPALPTPVRTVILRALEVEPEKRYATAHEMSVAWHRAIREWQREAPAWKGEVEHAHAAPEPRPEADAATPYRPTLLGDATGSQPAAPRLRAPRRSWAGRVLAALAVGCVAAGAVAVMLLASGRWRPYPFDFGPPDVLPPPAATAARPSRPDGSTAAPATMEQLQADRARDAAAAVDLALEEGDLVRAAAALEAGRIFAPEHEAWGPLAARLTEEREFAEAVSAGTAVALRGYAEAWQGSPRAAEALALAATMELAPAESRPDAAAVTPAAATPAPTPPPADTTPARPPQPAAPADDRLQRATSAGTVEGWRAFLASPDVPPSSRLVAEKALARRIEQEVRTRAEAGEAGGGLPQDEAARLLALIDEGRRLNATGANWDGLREAVRGSVGAGEPAPSLERVRALASQGDLTGAQSVLDRLQPHDDPAHRLWRAAMRLDSAGTSPAVIADLQALSGTSVGPLAQQVVAAFGQPDWPVATGRTPCWACTYPVAAGSLHCPHCLWIQARPTELMLTSDRGRTVLTWDGPRLREVTTITKPSGRTGAGLQVPGSPLRWQPEELVMRFQYQGAWLERVDLGGTQAVRSQRVALPGAPWWKASAVAILLGDPVRAKLVQLVPPSPFVPWQAVAEYDVEHDAQGRHVAALHRGGVAYDVTWSGERLAAIVQRGGPFERRVLAEGDRITGETLRLLRDGEVVERRVRHEVDGSGRVRASFVDLPEGNVEVRYAGF